MAFAPITVPGVVGEITTAYSFWTGYKFFLDGERIKPHGFPRNRLTIPGTPEPVRARIKGGLFRAHPTVLVGETEYPTGPPTPGFLQALAVLPFLSILILQGALGFLLAFGGVAFNMGTVRGSRTNRTKAVILAGTFVAIAAIDVLALAVWVSTTS